MAINHILSSVVLCRSTEPPPAHPLVHRALIELAIANHRLGSVWWPEEPNDRDPPNPENIEHILKTRFENYPKGKPFTDLLGDFLGIGIFKR
ncbi:hypothetical protein HanRHA438_Chr02g0051421 [Helianthus annuus]|nr:hypothetical protein HanRHA438_Chr02g0051421 [Helianthus annuus]